MIVTQDIDEGIEGVEGCAHDEPGQQEAVEVSAEGRDDAAYEEDGVGDDESWVPGLIDQLIH